MGPRFLIIVRFGNNLSRNCFRPESPFSAPVPGNCIAPEANYKRKAAFVSKKPTVLVEKPGDLLPSLPRLPHRKLSKPIAQTPIHPPLPSVIRLAVFAVCQERQQHAAADGGFAAAS